MAQIRNFTSTNDSYFVLDGVSYPKVYEAMLDNGYTKDKVKLVGTNRDSSPLVFSTHYSNIRVDGASFASANEAISRLNQVVFSKGGGSGGGGTTGESYIEITKSQLDTHISNSTLKAGVLYGIKETERWMLLGDSTDTLFLRAVSTNQLETKGTGKFFVPKYDQNVDGYGIWQGEVYEAFPTTVPEPNYAVNDKVIWGGRLWNNVTGNLGTKVDIYTLSSDWEVIPFNETDYNVRFDKIEYDYQNDMVIYRKDDAGNEISTSYEDWYFKENDYFDGNPLNISLWNSIKIYQWGNEFKNDTRQGCGGNIVTSSILECLNTCGSIYYDILENNSFIYYNTLINSSINYNTLNNSSINYNTLKSVSIGVNTLNNSSIESNILENGSTIDSNILTNGNISNNNVKNMGRILNNTLNDGYIRLGLTNTINGKEIKHLTINGGDIGGNTGIDLSSAILVYVDFTREVFKNSAGVTKIRYVDGNGATIIANLTD